MKNRTTIYLDQQLQTKLKIFAASRDVNVSKLISDVMEQFLEPKADGPIIGAGFYPKGGYDVKSND